MQISFQRRRRQRLATALGLATGSPPGDGFLGQPQRKSLAALFLAPAPSPPLVALAESRRARPAGCSLAFPDTCWRAGGESDRQACLSPQLRPAKCLSSGMSLAVARNGRASQGKLTGQIVLTSSIAKSRVIASSGRASTATSLRPAKGGPARPPAARRERTREFLKHSSVPVV